MPMPRIIFKINKKMDLQTGLLFRNVKAGGVDFKKWGLLAPHPALKVHKLLSSRVIKAYANHYYQQHEKELKTICKKMAREWGQFSKTFFALTKKIFRTHPFPVGDYRCYLSIWNCNPRDIRHKSFQIFYRKKNCVEAIAHEMLHFIFYDYFYKQCPYSRRPAYAKKVWELSEAFNTVVLNSSRWRKQLHIKKQYPYPELRRLVRIMSKQWKQNQSAEHLLQTMLTIKKREAFVCFPRDRRPPALTAT